MQTWSSPSTSRILVVDDEPALRHLLKAYLRKEGYAVVEAGNGPDALHALRNGAIDLALIDVMLPGLDGFELVRQIRVGSSVPIVLLTARGEETSRVTGLELGADDYVVKPFSAPEVVARVRAHLRRAQAFHQPEPVLRVGSIELDQVSRRCTVDGRPIELTRRELDLLAVLLESSDRVLTRDQLLDAAWGTTFMSPKTVDVHVATLRRKLGGALKISSLRGVGYRLDSS